MPSAVAAPSDTVPLDRAALGRCRDLRRRVDLADAVYVARAKALLEPIQARLRRCPGRNFRPEMLAQLERDWHHKLGSDYRLGCESKLAKESLSISDVAISAAALSDPAWNTDEPSLVIVHGMLDIARGRVTFTSFVSVLFSLHCCARWCQRHGATSDAELLDDIALAAAYDATAIPVGEGCAIHTAHGSWRGRCIQLPAGSRAIALRTWLPA
jgi:hypothetical protein